MSEIEKRLNELDFKYYSLVWFRQNHEKDPARAEYIQKEYPEACGLMMDNVEWNDGFNSGMLAAIRLFKAHFEGTPGDVEKAEAEFPNLNVK